MELFRNKHTLELLFERKNKEHDNQDEGDSTQDLATQVIQLAVLVLADDRRDERHQDEDNHGTGQHDHRLDDQLVGRDGQSLVRGEAVDHHGQTEAQTHHHHLRAEGVVDGGVAVTLARHLQVVLHIRHAQDEGDE